MKFLVALVLAASLALAPAHVVDEIGGNRVLRQEVDVDVQGHRELWGSGWSWTNILFLINVCGNPSDNCPNNPGPICGCPDCCHPVPPHIKNGYCQHHPCGGSHSSGGGGGGGDDDSADDDSADDDSADDDDQSSADGDGDDRNSLSNQASTETGGSSRGATYYATLLAYIVGASALAGVVGAYMWRRRVAAAAGAKGLEEEDTNSRALSPNDEDGNDVSFAAAAGDKLRNLSNHFGMMIGGAAAAAGIAGIGAAAAARRSNDTDDSENGDELSGSVSRRYGMMTDGNGIASYDDDANPEFIEVAPRSYYSLPAAMNSKRTFGVAEIRPSSHLTI